MTPGSIEAQANRLDKSVAATQSPPIHAVASRRGGPGDRVVMDGYTPFLIDKLQVGVDVGVVKSFCGISKSMCVPVHTGRVTLSRKRERLENAAAFEHDEDVMMRSILVSTWCGDIHQPNFVVVSVPLKVLQTDN